MNKKAFADLAHLLPPAALQLIEVAGIEATFTLIRLYPGTHFPIGRNKIKSGKILHAALAEVVGEAEADRIEAAYATQRKLWIPKCHGAVLELRNRLIRSQFDELTQNMPAYLAVKNLALAHKLVERQVWRITKQLDQQPDPTETMQMPLF